MGKRAEDAGRSAGQWSSFGVTEDRDRHTDLVLARRGLVAVADPSD